MAGGGRRGANSKVSELEVNSTWKVASSLRYHTIAFTSHAFTEMGLCCECCYYKVNHFHS